MAYINDTALDILESRERAKKINCFSVSALVTETSVEQLLALQEMTSHAGGIYGMIYTLGGLEGSLDIAFLTSLELGQFLELTRYTLHHTAFPLWYLCRIEADNSSAVVSSDTHLLPLGTYIEWSPINHTNCFGRIRKKRTSDFENLEHILRNWRPKTIDRGLR